MYVRDIKTAAIFSILGGYCKSLDLVGFPLTICSETCTGINRQSPVGTCNDNMKCCLNLSGKAGVGTEGKYNYTRIYAFLRRMCNFPLILVVC